MLVFETYLKKKLMKKQNFCSKIFLFKNISVQFFLIGQITIIKQNN